MKEDEAVKKQFRKLENRLEADYANLQEEVKGLKEQVCQDEWTIHGLLTHMEVMEARMALLLSQVAVVAPVERVDLTREEDEGGVGGPIVGPPYRYRTPSPISPFELDEVTAGAIEALGRNWEFLGDAAMCGDYTPIGPNRQSPEL